MSLVIDIDKIERREAHKAKVKKDKARKKLAKMQRPQMKKGDRPNYGFKVTYNVMIGGVGFPHPKAFTHVNISS